MRTCSTFRTCATALTVLVALASTAAALEVAVLPVDGEECVGALAGVNPDGAVRVQDRVFKLADIAEIRFRTTPGVGAKDKQRIRLRNGDALFGLVVAGDDKTLRMQSSLLGELALRNDLVLGVVFPIKEPPAESVVQQFFSGPDTDQDRMLTPKGETLACFLEGLTDKELKLDLAGQKRAFPLDQVAAFRYAPLKPVPPEKGLRAVVQLSDGSALSGALSGFAEEKLSVTGGGGMVWGIPAAAIRAITVKGGKLVYLSDLEPAADEKPLVGGAPLVFRWRRDLNAAGERLRIGRKEYAKGAGVHSYARLVFTLDAPYARFLADVGLDARATAGAVCAWKVIGDGRELQAGEARAGAEPVKLRLDVSGVRSLALVCDYGPDQDDAGDLLDWADARLVRD